MATELQRIMSEKKIDVTELADQSGVDKGSITKAVNGTQRPKLNKINKICKVLEMERHEVFPEYCGKPEDEEPEEKKTEKSSEQSSAEPVFFMKDGVDEPVIKDGIALIKATSFIDGSFNKVKAGVTLFHQEQIIVKTGIKKVSKRMIICAYDEHATEYGFVTHPQLVKHDGEMCVIIREHGIDMVSIYPDDIVAKAVIID